MNGILPDRISNMHRTLDIYPLSIEKALAIKDMFGRKDLLKNEAEYLFNFSIYHSRWNELYKDDFVENNSCEKGAVTITKVETPNQMSEFDEIEMYNNDENINMQYLRKMIAYCKENNIEVLLIYLPFPANDLDIAISKRIDKIANECGIKYINFLGMDTVDLNIDCQDKDSHLNQSGGIKVTDYIGKYIKENYDVPDQRENESYSFWNKDYDKYIDLKISNLEKNKNNLNNYLMLLYGENDISYEIKISSNIKLNEDRTLQKLLENLDNNYEIDDEEFKDNPKVNIKITTWDKRDGKIIDSVWF